MLEIVFDFINGLGTLEFILILALFIVFVYLSKKFIKTVINAVWIAIASAIFPVILVKVFNYPMALDIQTILSFVTIGLGLYILYLFGKIVYKVLTVTEKGIKAVGYPVILHRKHKKEKLEKNMEKFMKEKEKEGKKIKKEDLLPKNHKNEEDDEEIIDLTEDVKESKPVLPMVVGKKEKKKDVYSDYVVMKHPKPEEDKKESPDGDKEKKEDKKTKHVKPLKVIKEDED